MFVFSCEICRKTVGVSAALYPVVHTDPGLGDPVVQSAPQHHPGCRARVGERWDGWDKTTAGSGSPWAYLGSGRAVGLHSENKRPGQGTECLFLRKSFDKRSEVKLVSEFFFVLDNYLYFAICIENLLSHNIHSLCLKHKKKNVIAVMVYFRVCSVALSKAAVKLLPANVAWKLASSSCFQSQLPSIIANTFETKCDMQLSAKGDVITGCNSFSLLLPPEHFQSCPEE